jgi:hypothetical protein
VSHQGQFYRIAPSEVGPKPVQSHIPVLLGSMSPAGVARAARIADGINPIVFSEEVLRELISAFHAAADEQGRDPADLTVVARANVPITVDPIGEGRPFLGGSPQQIANDLARGSTVPASTACCFPTRWPRTSTMRCGCWRNCSGSSPVDQDSSMQRPPVGQHRRERP